MKKIRIGYLGVGPRAQVLLDCYAMHPQAEFVAFADIAESRAADVAAIFNKAHGTDVKAYTCYEDMINNENLDALLIASDPSISAESLSTP